MSKVHKIVTDKIVAALAEGTVPWQRPWAAQAPRNYVSGAPYRGVNRLLTEIAPYGSPDWLTFNQIRAAGAKLPKGSASTLITYYGFTKKDSSNEDDDAPKRGFLRYYLIFNAQQIENLPAKTAEVPSPLAVETVRDGYVGGPSYGGSPTKASYAPALDRIDIPLPGAFTSPEAYARTLFHEMIHSTGHPTRLNRFSCGSSPSTEEYSKEELVAEIGAAMLMAATGLSGNVVASASYIASWLRQLQNNSFLVVSAASQAQKAVDHILGQSPEKDGGEAA